MIAIHRDKIRLRIRISAHLKRSGVPPPGDSFIILPSFDCKPAAKAWAYDCIRKQHRGMPALQEHVRRHIQFVVKPAISWRKKLMDTHARVHNHVWPSSRVCYDGLGNEMIQIPASSKVRTCASGNEFEFSFRAGCATSFPMLCQIISWGSFASCSATEGGRYDVRALSSRSPSSREAWEPNLRHSWSKTSFGSRFRRQRPKCPLGYAHGPAHGGLGSTT